MHIICQSDKCSEGRQSRITRTGVPTGGAWVAQLVKYLPSAQVMIPEFWDVALNQSPCLMGNLLLPLLCPSTRALFLALSLPLSQINK